MNQTRSLNKVFRTILLAGGLFILSCPTGWAAAKVAPVLTFSESWKDFPGCTGSGANLNCNEFGEGQFTVKAVITSNDFGIAIDPSQFNAETTFDITLGNYSFGDNLGDAPGYVAGATKATFKLTTQICNAAGTHCSSKVYETITLSWTTKAVTIAIAAKTGADINGNTFEDYIDADTYDGNDSGPIPGGTTIGFEMDLGDNLTVASDGVPETGTVVTKTDANGDPLSTIKIEGTLTPDELDGGATTEENLNTLYTFTGDLDGGNPLAGLVPDNNGNFYGTTTTGGTSNNGTVFQISSAGTLTTLYSFADDTDGSFPNGLVQGSDGNFYGTTAGDGGDEPSANGTVFQITSTGAFTTLYTFTGGTDGASPLAALVQGSDSNFYGTTFGGGANGNGTVFKISATGTLTTLYSFADGTDGGEPTVGVVPGKDGNFYGTTEQGGASGNGNVFKITPTGTFTTLYSFAGLNDGDEPAALVLGKDGSFYGTTGDGGAQDGGTAFKFNPASTKANANGTLTTIYSFTGLNDGNGPAALVQGKDGNFYGTTQGDGADGEGTVFEMTPSGNLTVLYTFTGDTDGSNPNGLVQGQDGNFYGTTQTDGADGFGTVFAISPP